MESEAALASGTIRGTYMRRTDRKVYSYTLIWTSTSRDLTWSATVEAREGAGLVISRPSGTCGVAAGITPPELEQMARSAAHAILERAVEAPRGRLALLRAALRRLPPPDGTTKS